MAHDDRDRNFEKALARQLRSPYSGVDSNALAGAPLDSCPDPEILAAYHEQALSSGELSLWKEHVVACSRCQFVLAQLAATDKITLDASPAEDPLLISERPSSRKERSLDSRSIDRERRSPSWRWVLLIPAGAIAAGLVAFISLREPKPLPVSSSPVEVAENRPAPAVSPSSQAAPSSPAKAKDENAQSSAPPGAAESRTPTLPAREAPLLSKTAPAPSAGSAAQRKRDRAATQFVDSFGPEQQKLILDERAAEIAAHEKAHAAKEQKALNAEAAAIDADMKKQSVAKQTQLPSSSEAGFVDGGSIRAPRAPNAADAPAAAPSALPTNAPAAKGKPQSAVVNADAISASAESVEVSAEPQTPARAKAMLRVAALQNPRVFVAPDGKHLWRLGPAGSLERSKDEGLKWTLQTSGVSADLLAGSAPSAQVAWVVGNSGTILRTTDGGAHWRKLDSPFTNDLTGVRATDAFHASIWFVADQQTGVTKTYETTDGGATWSPIPPK